MYNVSVSLSAGLSPLCGHGRWSPPRSHTPGEGTKIGTLGSSTWLSSCFKVMVKLRIQKVCTYNSIKLHYFDEIQFSRSVLSNSLQPHGLQHTRLPCPLPSPRICSKSCPLSQCCHPTVSSSSVIPFSSCPQSFLGSGSFPNSQLFPSGGQSNGASASASVLPMNIQGWFPLGWTGLILQSKGLSRVFSNTTVQKHQVFGIQLSL